MNGKWRIMQWGLAAGILVFGGAAEAVTTNGVTQAVLQNGLRVVIVRNPLSPVVATVINYEAGSDEAPDGFPGTAHAQEHMMFRGSPGLSAAQLANISAAVGGDFNADTQQSATQYFFTMPSEDLELALRIEALRMKGLDSDEKLWTQERGAIEQEVAADLSNPEYVFYTNLLTVVFKNTPYEHDPLGSRPTFDLTTGAMLKKFHDTWYVPNNAVLVIVGDVDGAATLELVRRVFNDIPSGAPPRRPDFNFSDVAAQTIKLDTDSPTGLAEIAFRFPGYGSVNFAAAQVLADVLGSQRARLYALVPEGKALAAGFSYDTLPRAGLGYAIASFPAGADAGALLAQMRTALLAEITNGIADDLVEAAKRREVASLEFAKNSVSGLAMAWSQALAVEGRESPEDDVTAIRAVTTADVNRVADELLDTNHAVMGILTPRPSGKPVSNKGFGGKESFAVGESSGTSLPAWAEQALQRLEVPVSALHPTVTLLTNGLRLIVQPETISDTVGIYGRVKNNPDMESPPHQEGVDDALSQLFSYGTRSLDRIAYQKALDDIGATEAAGSDFSIQALGEDFERAAQLLADNVLAPALPADEFAVLQPQMAAAVAGELESPGYLQGRALKKGLFPKSDPSQRETTPASVKKLTMKDVTNYYARAFRPDLTTIVVIGKVAPEKARSVIEKYFGGWAAAGAPPETVLPAVPNNVAWTTQTPDASRVQDDVTLAETLGVTLSNPDHYALQLGNHVLGGAFYATRLYHDLRQEAGLVYFVDSDLQFGEKRSIYRITYGCDPPNVGKARAIIVGNLRSMRERDVSDAELRQAKGLLLREIPLSESSVDRIAQGWLYRATHNLPLDEPTIAARHYYQMTAPEVRAAFAKWIRPNDLVQVSLGP
ncbi:MAG TPA: pitrilysin family protein [Verrucomicrobiae bacterium]|jgi:zinc protease|nr:pitrilysin family protein [Verrucomicrobiae bacterium]